MTALSTFFIYVFTGHPVAFVTELARATKHQVGLAQAENKSDISCLKKNCWELFK